MEIIQLYRRKSIILWTAVDAVSICLLVGLFGEMRRSGPVLWCAVTVAVAAVARFTYRGISGAGARQFQRYLESLPSPEQAELCRQYREQSSRDQAVLCEQCIVRMTRLSLLAIPYGDVVWAYQAGQTTRASGKVATIILVTADKKTYLADLYSKDSAYAHVFLEELSRRAPGIFIGRDRETARLFRRDFDGMRALVQQNREKSS